MKRIKLSKKDYLQKVNEIAEKLARKQARDWNIPQEQVEQFVALQCASTVAGATEKRNSWIIYDTDGTSYEYPRNYKPYAPMN